MMTGYKNTEEFRAQGGRGTFKLTGDFEVVPYSGQFVRDINMTPSDRRLPDMAICRIFSNREDAEKILRALQSSDEN
jgi:hypothetical protein